MVALLYLFCGCLCSVSIPHSAIVAFPGHTHLLFQRFLWTYTYVSIFRSVGFNWDLGNSVYGKQKPLIIIENLHLLHAYNKGADQPAHLRSLISAFVIGNLESVISKLASYQILIF